MSAATVGVKQKEIAVAAQESNSNWRIAQLVLTVMVLAVALLYHFSVWVPLKGTVGGWWKSPTVTQAPMANAMNSLPKMLSVLKYPLAPFVLLENWGFFVLLAFVWVASPTSWVIARATWQETIRKRVLNVILLIGLLMVGSSVIFSWMNPGEEEKFIRDVGLGAILTVGVIIAIVMASMLIPQEIERKTVFTILSKPVDRFQYILGKFMGTCLTLLTNLAIMGGLFCLLYWHKRAGVHGADVMFETQKNVQAIIMMFFELSVVAAVCVMVSILSSSVIFTIACGFFVFLAGQMSDSWQHIKEHTDKWEHIISFVYYVLPRLDNFDVREKLIVDDPIYFNYMWHAIAGGLVYTAAVLVLSRMFFNDREF